MLSDAEHGERLQVASCEKISHGEFFRVAAFRRKKTFPVSVCLLSGAKIQQRRLKLDILSEGKHKLLKEIQQPKEETSGGTDDL